jgi:hypothetical protein
MCTDTHERAYLHAQRDRFTPWDTSPHGDTTRCAGLFAHRDADGTTQIASGYRYGNVQARLSNRPGISA